MTSIHDGIQIPTTQNEEWGFWGTMGSNAKAAWPLACKAIANATRQDMESVRVFLDSSHGRQFAYDVCTRLHLAESLNDEIVAATNRWMDWKIGQMTSRCYGIPFGIPYLTGLVANSEICDWSDWSLTPAQICELKSQFNLNADSAAVDE
jgi:hypothetical protein